MTRHAIPDVLSADEMNLVDKYGCPLCRVQTTNDAVDTGWVLCPMLNHQALCLGCCIDVQSAARADNFDAHFDRDLFNELSRITDKDVLSLRLMCLNHQEKVIEDDLIPSADEKGRKQLSALLEQVRKHQA